MIYDVVVAGAGPVGLFLASELRLAGVSVLVLEKEADRHAPLKRLPFGLRGLNAPSLDAFHRRDLLPAVDARRLPLHGPEAKGRGAAHWVGQRRRPAGHFAGIQFYEDRIDASQWPWRLPGPAGLSLAIDLESLEGVLETRALALGAVIERGVAIAGFEQGGEYVAIRTNKQVFQARWLVGCDGGRSTVRKAGGFAFDGTDPEFTGYSVDVELDDAQALPQGRHYTPTGMFTFGPPGMVAMVEFDAGACHRAALTRDHVQGVLRRVSGIEVTVKALHVSSTWTDRAYQATTYRKGRVLLAGDAAHIHSPLGGQGLNLGIGDAMNLGWKLAATVRGDARDGLLDTYTEERLPVGAQVLDWSRAQVGLMRPGPSSRALQTIFRDLMDTRDGATYFAGRVGGVGLRHELGDSHPLVGRSMPDFALTDGTLAGEHLRAGKGLLLDFGQQGPLQDRIRERGDRIVYVASGAMDRLGLGALLVRPDGIVAWVLPADDVEAPISAVVLDELDRRMARWFGGMPV